MKLPFLFPKTKKNKDVKNFPQLVQRYIQLKITLVTGQQVYKLPLNNEILNKRLRRIEAYCDTIFSKSSQGETMIPAAIFANGSLTLQGVNSTIPMDTMPLTNLLPANSGTVQINPNSGVQVAGLLVNYQGSFVRFADATLIGDTGKTLILGLYLDDLTVEQRIADGGFDSISSTMDPAIQRAELMNISAR